MSETNQNTNTATPVWERADNLPAHDGYVEPELAPITVEEANERRENYLKVIRGHTPKYAGHAKRAFMGKSLRAAINAKCIDCCNFDTIQIKYCPCAECSLWQYRPYKASKL